MLPQNEARCEIYSTIKGSEQQRRPLDPPSLHCCQLSLFKEESVVCVCVCVSQLQRLIL